MEKRVKSWINKKIVEYIGEEEPSLCGFICSKVLAKSAPENILQDVAIVSFCSFFWEWFNYLEVFLNLLLLYWICSEFVLNF